MSFGKPRPLSKEGIEEVVELFAYAAEAAYKTGCGVSYLQAFYLLILYDV